MAKQNEESTGFGRRLRALREAAGLSQTELGERSGMAYQAVARLEREDREPTWPTAIRLADALGIDVGAFRLSDANNPVSPDRTRSMGKRK